MCVHLSLKTLSRGVVACSKMFDHYGDGSAQLHMMRLKMNRDTVGCQSLIGMWYNAFPSPALAPMCPQKGVSMTHAWGLWATLLCPRDGCRCTVHGSLFREARMWRATLGDPGNVGNVADCPRASGNLTRVWGQVTAERTHQWSGTGQNKFENVQEGPQGS